VRIIRPSFFVLLNVQLPQPASQLLIGTIVGPYDGSCTDHPIIPKIAGSPRGGFFETGIRGSVSTLFAVLSLWGSSLLRRQETFSRFATKYIGLCLTFRFIVAAVGWIWKEIVNRAYPHIS